MEDLDQVMLDEVSEETSNKRPVFLTVLCILTWVWSGLVSILGGIFSIFTYEKTVSDFKKSKELFDHSTTTESERALKGMASGIMDSANSFIEHGLTLNYFTIGTGVFCIIGALLMFKLKKIGFLIYLVSTIVFIAAPIYLMSGNLLAIGTSLFYGLFGLLFIILYGVNLKHMKA